MVLEIQFLEKIIKFFFETYKTLQTVLRNAFTSQKNVQ